MEGSAHSGILLDKEAEIRSLVAELADFKSKMRVLSVRYEALEEKEDTLQLRVENAESVKASSQRMIADSKDEVSALETALKSMNATAEDRIGSLQRECADLKQQLTVEAGTMQ